jgi:DNA-binding SARP family transcriptional activator
MASLADGRWFRQRTRAAELLLGYFALHGARLHPREKLAALLWKESDSDLARNALRTTLWRLRSSLEPDGATRGSVIRGDRAGDVGLNWDDGVWCDVQTFRAAMPPSILSERVAPDASALAQLRQAIDLYRGDLLDSFYEDWVIVERAALQEALSHALDILMRAAERDGDCETALDYGRRLLAVDPLRESIHRRVIALYMQLGDRSRALRQFDDCARALKAEFAVDPMPETLALRERITAGAFNGGTFDLTDQSIRFADDLRDAILRVEGALNGLESARARYVAHAGLEVARTKPST